MVRSCRFVEDEELFDDPYKEVSPASSDAVLAAVLAMRAAPADTSGQVRCRWLSDALY
jgi:hypothetical protein